MAYDERLASRIRALLGPFPGLVEKKMFGGVGFLVSGNMACGVHKNDLIVRVGPVNYHEALERPHVHPLDMTGKAMSGWVMVEPPGCETEGQLNAWIGQGIDFASSLPAKGG